MIVVLADAKVSLAHLFSTFFFSGMVCEFVAEPIHAVLLFSSTLVVFFLFVLGDPDSVGSSTPFLVDVFQRS